MNNKRLISYIVRNSDFKKYPEIRLLKLINSLEKIFNKNISYAKNVGIEVDDIISIIWMGVQESYTKYEETISQENFVGIVLMVVKSRIIDYFRRMNTSTAQLLQDAIASYKLNEGTYKSLENLSDPIQGEGRKFEMKEHIINFTKNNSELKKFSVYFLNGYSDQEISSKLSLSIRTVSRYKKKMINGIAELFDNTL